MAKRSEDDLVLRCDCVGACAAVAVAQSWDEDNRLQYRFAFYEHVAAQEGWRGRLRIAWQVLRGRGPYVHGLVLYAEKAAQLRDFLVRTVPGGRASTLDDR